jgi:hypothetical protein
MDSKLQKIQKNHCSRAMKPITFFAYGGLNFKAAHRSTPLSHGASMFQQVLLEQAYRSITHDVVNLQDLHAQL